VHGPRRSLLYAGLLVLVFCLGVVSQQGSLMSVGVTGILFMAVRAFARLPAADWDPDQP
jgi:hypothetical protein